MNYISFSVLLATCFALQACTTPLPAPKPASDPASVRIDEALATKAGGKPIGPETPVVRPVYGESTTVSFMGSASILLADAASGRGGSWSFKETGPHPRLPIYVQVSVKGVSFTEFLSDVALQLGQRADIGLDGTTLELRYRSNE